MTDTNNTHSFSLENRNILSLTVVSDVLGFDEETVSMETQLGNLIVKGEGLHITKLSLDTGEVVVEGKVNAFQYLGGQKSKNFLGKLFK